MAGEFGAERPDDDAIADARRWNLPPDEIEAVREMLGTGTDDKLWAMHEPAFTALCASGTAWRMRFAIDGGRIVGERVQGLDYAALKAVLDGLRLALSPQGWSDLLVLERHAVKAMNGEQF